MLGTIKLASVALAAGASLTGTAPAMASTHHIRPRSPRGWCATWSAIQPITGVTPTPRSTSAFALRSGRRCTTRRGITTGKRYGKDKGGPG